MVKCKLCLPNCNKIEFNIKEILTKRLITDFIYYNNTKYINNILQIYFDFKIKEIKYLSSFELTDYLNYINGLWSLFLGISILSIWELVEFIYQLCMHKKPKFIKRDFDLSCFNRFFNAFEILFNGTYIHGIKYLFDKDNFSKTNCVSVNNCNRNTHKFMLRKLRWLFVIVIIFIFLCVMIKNAIENYTKYDTVYKRSYFLFEEKINQNKSDQDHFLDHQLTFLICSPIEFRENIYQVIYKSLTTKANDLFKSKNKTSKFNNFFQIEDAYKQFANNLIDKLSDAPILSIQKISYHKNISTAIKLYKKIFRAKILEIEIIGLDDNKNLQLDYYMDTTCILYETNLTIKNFFKFQYVEHDAKLSVYKVTMLDSKSLYSTKLSSFDLLESHFELVASFKRITYLNEPYTPSCLNQPPIGYTVDKCIKKCINEIIVAQFGCKLIHEKYENSSDNSNYCHPFMLPFIKAYENYELDNTLCISKCKHPCEIYYYEVEQKLKPSSQFFLLKVENSIEFIEQIPIYSLTNTILIIISFFGLFFGGSLLALMQIFSNIFKITFKSQQILIYKFDMRARKFLDWSYVKKFLTFVNTISHSTTIHCASYIASSSGFLKRILWLIFISLVVVLAILYSISEIKFYLNSGEKINLINIISNDYEEIEFANQNQFILTLFMLH